MSGIDYLLDPTKHSPGVLCAVSGDDGYLKREVIQSLRRQACGDDQGDFAWQTFVGKETEWRDVRDSLSAVSLFGGGQQAALVEDADTFVTRYRTQLEDYVAKPPAGALLVLDVKMWAGNTRLAKAAAKVGLALKCGAPDRGAELNAFKRSAKRWLTQRAEAIEGAKLSDAAIEVMFERLPMSLGLLDQEVTKLALIAGPGKPITPAIVQQHVGGWRAQKTWDMVDAMADGNATSALEQLDKLLLAGEQPIGLLAQVSSTLRRFATATVLIKQAEARGQRPNLRQALEHAGVAKFKLNDAQTQLKQIGRHRAAKLDDWLLDADLALKGHNSTGPRARFELERLIVRLSKDASVKR